MKRIRIISSILALACIGCVNIHVLTSDNVIENFLELKDVEALAYFEVNSPNSDNNSNDYSTYTLISISCGSWDDAPTSQEEYNVWLAEYCEEQCISWDLARFDTEAFVDRIHLSLPTETTAKMADACLDLGSPLVPCDPRYDTTYCY